MRIAAALYTFFPAFAAELAAGGLYAASHFPAQRDMYAVIFYITAKIVYLFLFRAMEADIVIIINGDRIDEDIFPG